MAITRWEPFGTDLHDWLHRWMDVRPNDQGWISIEEVQEDKDLVIRAEAPGVDPDQDIDVSVTDSTLHISVKREEKSQQKDKGRSRSEFRYGEFRRDLLLPKGVDGQAVKAAYKDGILEVRIPWPSQAKAPTSKIPVSRS